MSRHLPPYYRREREREKEKGGNEREGGITWVNVIMDLEVLTGSGDRKMSLPLTPVQRLS